MASRAAEIIELLTFLSFILLTGEGHQSIVGLADLHTLNDTYFSFPTQPPKLFSTPL